MKVKTLYKGVFNLNGQSITLFGRAYSELQARRMFIRRISNTYNIPVNSLSSIFDGRKDNYRVTKEEKS